MPPGDGVPDRVAVRAGRLRRFLAGALPFWQSHGWDGQHGGFADRLEASGAIGQPARRRLMVQARQLFLFSTLAPRLGLELSAKLGLADAGQRAQALFRCLVEGYWDRTAGGWYFAVDLDGTLADPTKDCYGHAFALFGLAHYFAASGDGQALLLAQRTIELMRAHLLLPSGAFASRASADWHGIDGPILQNPHMHYLEACLAWTAASDHPLFRAEAERLIGLFLAGLFDQATGTIPEVLDGDLRPDPAQGHRREPGHHFEWAWLLECCAERFGRPELAGVADRLHGWAMARGLDRERGGIFDEVETDGTVVLATKRCWPVTEAIKSAALRYRLRGQAGDLEALDGFLGLLVDTYLGPAPVWHERFDRDFRPVETGLPTSTLYHLGMAALETMLPSGGQTAPAAAH